MPEEQEEQLKKPVGSGEEAPALPSVSPPSAPSNAATPMSGGALVSEPPFIDLNEEDEQLFYAVLTYTQLRKLEAGRASGDDNSSSSVAAAVPLPPTIEEFASRYPVQLRPQLLKMLHQLPAPSSDAPVHEQPWQAFKDRLS